MSDKITKTVTYEIEPSGNCKNCKCSILVQDWRDGDLNCLAFPDSDIDGWKQCQACKDYLAEAKEFKEEQDSWNTDVPLGFMQSSEDRSE